MTAEERRKRATEAAIEVAGRFGIHSQTARVLKDSNNTIIHLLQAGIVAKVGTSTIQLWDVTTLEKEVAVATHLVGKGAPVAQPSASPPSGPHRTSGGLLVSLWQYYEQVQPADVRAASFALRVVHNALADYAAPLPHFEVEFNRVAELLGRQDLLPRLPADERRYMQRAGEQIRKRLDVLKPGSEQTLHGAPHFGNLLQTPSGPLWTDFETACRGPVEWDLAGFPGRAQEAFPTVDEDRLATLRLMRSLTVSSKCWAQLGRAPEVDEAAHLHLRTLHENLR